MRHRPSQREVRYPWGGRVVSGLALSLLVAGCVRFGFDERVAGDAGAVSRDDAIVLLPDALGDGSEADLSGGPCSADDWCVVGSSVLNARLAGLWGADGHSLVGVGNGGTIVRHDGTHWLPEDSGVQADLWGVWGSGDDDIYAVGAGGTIVAYDGTRWNLVNSGTLADLNAVWGSGPSDVYAVGGGGTVLHFDGDSWQPQTTPWARPLNGVWGSGPTGPVYVVGEGAIIGSSDRVQPWTDVTTGLGLGDLSLQSIHGSDAATLFVVADGGSTAIHLEGGQWWLRTANTTAGLLGVWGVSAQEAYAVGRLGTIVRWDGSSWSPQSTGTTGTLQPIWRSAQEQAIYTIGLEGVLLRKALATP